ncbi:hypothetical protein D3C71_1680720 [compost metagenome]
MRTEVAFLENMRPQPAAARKRHGGTMYRPAIAEQHQIRRAAGLQRILVKLVQPVGPAPEGPCPAAPPVRCIAHREVHLADGVAAIG